MIVLSGKEHIPTFKKIYFNQILMTHLVFNLYYYYYYCFKETDYNIKIIKFKKDKNTDIFFSITFSNIEHLKTGTNNLYL